MALRRLLRLLPLLLGACTPVAPGLGPAPAPPVAAPETGKLGVSILHVVRKLGSEEVARVGYPRFHVPTASPAAAALNATLEADAAKYADEFVAGYREALRNGDAGPNPWSLDVHVTVPTLHDDLLVVVGEESDYTGGAHPNHHTGAATYHLRDGAFVRVSFGEAFVPSAAKTLDGPVVEALRAQEAGWVVDGTLTTVAPLLHTWWPEADGLHVVFDPYEAGPYAEGSHDVVLPWKIVGPVVWPDGPLRRFRPG